MRGGPFYSASAAERKQPCCSVRFSRAEPEQLIGLLGRTEPSLSDGVMPPSKPNRACTTTEPSRADPPLGLVAQCHTQIHATAHSCALYVCYTHAQPIRSQQCTGRQGQHGRTLRRDPVAGFWGTP